MRITLFCSLSMFLVGGSYTTAGDQHWLTLNLAWFAVQFTWSSSNIGKKIGNS